MSEPEETVEFHPADLLEAAATLYLIQEERGQTASGQTRQAYGRLRDANLLVTGVLASVLMRVQAHIPIRTSQSEERDALYASFVIGMDLCERAIEEARYLQALTLLRHEMETLAKLQAVQHGTRGRSCAPNLRNLEPSMKRMYGKLSDAVHLRVHATLRHATRSTHKLHDAPRLAGAARYFPMFDRELARRSFGLHIYLTLRLIDALGADLQARHSPVVSERELQAVNRAVELLLIEGVLERRDAGRLFQYRRC